MSESEVLQLKVRQMEEHFPWYSEWRASQAAGSGNGDERTGGALESFPLITAGVLETFYYTAVPPFEHRPELYRYQTSGTSSGRRKTIYYSEKDEARYLQVKTRVFAELVKRSGASTALADMGTGHAAATSLAVFRQLGLKAEAVSFQLPIEHHLERLAECRPHLLYTMPSILDRILLASPDPAGYGIRDVILVGEIASPAWRQRAAERLGIGAEHITDTYGSIEIGTIAYYSHAHGRYLLADGVLAEGVAAEALEEGIEPLAEDERVLVLTSLVRDLFPSLRFVTYDVVRDLRPIVVDGVLRQSFQSIVKRIGSELKHGEKISLYDIEDVVFRHLSEASVRVKVAGNALTVYVYSPKLTDALLQAIQRDLTDRIPEIGEMIRGRMLGEIRLIGGTFDDSSHRSTVKNKKIFYETRGPSSP
ncbi:CoF synthetase [Paenibacillus cremeus]|uniref:CoF synthetase n=1 Tax=Paenibacillus cremeus TaxID=2163881 RepID=A0A559KBL2_9BACL|nr:CoF synthetase [Paenibacillus cremeus]TVY09489.1 CoF synthetase [Paenibacillus cremeus]